MIIEVITTFETDGDSSWRLTRKEKLVRCKNCVKWHPGYTTENGCVIKPYCESMNGVWNENDYCSRPEEKQRII